MAFMYGKCPVVVSVLLLVLVDAVLAQDMIHRGRIERSTSDCEFGWTKYKNNCYKFYEEEKAWTVGRYYCEQQNARIVYINDEEENNWLASFCKENSPSSRFGYCWIGAEDFYGDGRWTWRLPNVRSEAVTYTNWYPGQPNGGKHERCAKIAFGVDQGKWDDSNCNRFHSYICKKW